MPLRETGWTPRHVTNRLDLRSTGDLRTNCLIIETEASVLNFSQDHPLIDQPLEWLGRADQAAIEEDFVPESAVEQVQYRVLGAANVKVNRHPVLLFFRVPGLIGVPGVQIPQIVPARPGPLGHGVGLAAALARSSEPTPWPWKAAARACPSA